MDTVQYVWLRLSALRVRLMPISTYHFYKATGRYPKDDDMERVNCPKAGDPGHAYCGWDHDNEKPVYETGNIKGRKEMERIAPKGWNLRRRTRTGSYITIKRYPSEEAANWAKFRYGLLHWFTDTAICYY